MSDGAKKAFLRQKPHYFADKFSGVKKHTFIYKK